MVGWSRARGKLAGEEGEVQQGDLKQWRQSRERREQKRDKDKMSNVDSMLDIHSTKPQSIKARNTDYNTLIGRSK